MKNITNWRNATVADIEANGLDDATLIHVLGYQLVGQEVATLKGSTHKHLEAFFKHHIKEGIPVIFHNGYSYDIPLVERLLGIDLSELMLIDTLDLSWYLNVKRDAHGLGTFEDEYGIAKVEIDESDWAFVSDCPIETKAHYERMKLRVIEDVRINQYLWQDFMLRLTNMYEIVQNSVNVGYVDGTRVSDNEVCFIDQYKNSSTVDEYIDRIISFLMMKAGNRRLKEKTRWKIDTDKLAILDITLGDHIEKAKIELEGVMPEVPKYAKKNQPEEMYKKNGELKVHAVAWNEFVDTLDQYDTLGNKIGYQDDEGQCWRINKYEPPNVNSPDQIKKWLFANGWKPKSFKWVKDKAQQQAWVDSGFKRELKPKPRGVPQINVEGKEGKELCPSVVKLAETIPEIMAYSKYSLIKHRYDIIQGFKENMSPDGYLIARMKGITNTLRIRHKELTNLPSTSKPWGQEIRELLTCVEGNVLLGSDLSGLEDRTKHHFMIPHDPDYVATMMGEGYDSHITMSLYADMVTKDEFDSFMHDKINKDNDDFEPKLSKQEATRIGVIRALGKSTNYSSVYNIGADALARDLGIAVKEAKVLLEGYWKLNWAVKVIAGEQCVFECSQGINWLINPINGFAYELRKESDRFSTLCQGTGSFFFDMWVDNILTEMDSRWGKRSLSGDFHDEFIISFKDTPKLREIMKEITLEAIDKVNDTYMLRRKLGCDIQFDVNYAGIH